MKEKSWEKLHIDKDQEPLGIGDEKKVYQDKENPDRVIGMYKRKEISPEQTKARYYLTKILHILLPKNIPDVHLSTAKPNAIMRKKVELGSAHHTIRGRMLEKGFLNKEKHIVEALGTIRNDVRIIELKRKLNDIGVNFDDFSGNFGIDNKGNAQYIEDFQPFNLSPNYIFVFNYSALEKAIMNLPQKEHDKAIKYLERLNDLAEEERKSLKKRGY